MRGPTSASSVREPRVDPKSWGDAVGPVARSCVRLGIAATGSLFLSLIVLMFLFDTPSVGRWFVASAALAALSFAAALIAARFE